MAVLSTLSDDKSSLRVEIRTHQPGRTTRRPGKPLDARHDVCSIADLITVNMHEAKTRLSKLVKAIEERNETVVLGRDVAEIRRRAKRRASRNLTLDPRFRVEFAPGYRPAEPFDDEWPDALR